MPSLRALTTGGSPRVYRVYKKITSIGRSPDNDVVLGDPLLADSHAHIQFDGRDFNITSIDRDGDLQINGKRRKKHRLEHGDVLRIGSTELEFSIYDGVGTDDGNAPAADATIKEVNSYRRLFEFSERLLANYNLQDLLDAFMDVVIEITGAQRGFLVLCEGSDLHVKVARNIRKETLADGQGQISDSIIEKVLATRKPLILSDALSDAEFANSRSVLSLKVSSVMCVPLLERGNLIGVIYVGNDSVTQLFSPEHLEVLTIFSSQASLLVRNALLVSELKLDKQALLDQVEQLRFGDIIGSCTAMQEVFKKISKVATTDISVLITGETGTGKELIARELHRRSGRAKGPFVTINCGAIPENLLESELFGHVRGAFTGAVANRTGKFQSADRGTLFLDEIGEMPLNLQVKILRALQERVVVRVGDNRAENVDIRIVAATNRDLEAEIKVGRFREDLYYRLNVVNIHLPPLRDRGEDIIVLAKYFLQRFAAEFGGSVRGLSPSAVVAMRKFEWAGNIRQLENALKKACVLAEGALIGPDDLGLSEGALAQVLSLAQAKEKFQREYINHVLELNGGNRTKTARDLDVDPRTIFRHLEKDDGDEPAL